MSKQKLLFDPDPEAYKKDIDRTLLRENLRLTVEQRFDNLIRLQEFAEELRKAQQRALAGKGAADLQKRLHEQRRAVLALAKLGRDILADEGRSVSDAIVERIAKTLDAAALDEGSRFLLRAGRLTPGVQRCHRPKSQLHRRRIHRGPRARTGARLSRRCTPRD